MSLSIRDIQYFLEIAQTGQLTSSAHELGISQPALSKAIQRVEQQFGGQLFERSVNGMQLTSAGLRVAEQLGRLQAQYADTLVLAGDMLASRAGLIRVGVTDITAGYRLSTALARLLAHRPGLRITVRVDRSDALAAQVRDGQLDLALVPAYENQNLQAHMLRVDHDPMLAVVRAAHPLTQLRTPQLADIAPYAWVMGGEQSAAYRHLKALFESQGLAAPTVMVEVPFASEFTLSLLAQTDLVSLVPRSFVRHIDVQQFVFLPIAQLQLERAVVLISRHGASWSPLMTALRDALLASALQQQTAADIDY